MTDCHHWADACFVDGDGGDDDNDDFGTLAFVKGTCIVTLEIRG